jgi:hypothetical protein
VSTDATPASSSLSRLYRHGAAGLKVLLLAGFIGAVGLILVGLPVRKGVAATDPVLAPVSAPVLASDVRRPHLQPARRFAAAAGAAESIFPGRLSMETAHEIQP